MGEQASYTQQMKPQVLFAPHSSGDASELLKKGEVNKTQTKLTAQLNQLIRSYADMMPKTISQFLHKWSDGIENMQMTINASPINARREFVEVMKAEIARRKEQV